MIYLSFQESKMVVSVDRTFFSISCPNCVPVISQLKNLFFWLVTFWTGINLVVSDTCLIH